MMLSDQDVERLREIYRNAYGEEMPPEEARMWAIRLVRLYRILLRPLPHQRASNDRSLLITRLLPHSETRPIRPHLGFPYLAQRSTDSHEAAQRHDSGLGITAA